MNVSRTVRGRAGTPRRSVRLGSLLLSVLAGAGVLVAVDGPAAALPAAGEKRLYVITNGLTGHVMDNANQSTEPGNPIIQWPLNDGPNQEWLLTTVDGVDYRLANRQSGLCLTGNPDHTVTQDLCGTYNGRNRWQLKQLSNGTFHVQLGTNPWTGGPAATDGYAYLAAPATPTPGGGLKLVDWGIHDITWRIKEVSFTKPYTFETGASVPGWQVRTLTGECQEGWRVETVSRSTKPRYDYVGDSDLNVHDLTAKIVDSNTGTKLGSIVDLGFEPQRYRTMTVDVGNPLWHTMDAKIRVYCVPVPPDA